jgi:uncharacterized membrane protein YfcA
MGGVLAPLALGLRASAGRCRSIFLSSVRHGHHVRRAVGLLVGVVAGVQLGARISLRLRGAVIQWLPAAALLAPAARPLFTA